jgi:hypothetical protein
MDMNGAELEPFQLQLFETLGVEPTNYRPVGDMRDAARQAVAAAVARGPRYDDDVLYERAVHWLNSPHEGSYRFQVEP